MRYLPLFAYGQQLKPIQKIVTELGHKGIAAAESDVAQALERVMASGIMENDLSAPQYALCHKFLNFLIS